MKGSYKVRGMHLIAGLAAATLIGLTALSAYPATVTPEKAERLAKQFVLDRLRGPNGLILTNGKVRRLLLFPVFDPDDLLASGALSESSGLILQYAVSAGDRALFDDQLNLLRQKMLGQFGLFYWKVSHDGELIAGSSASIDDLRVVGACLHAAKRWNAKEYLAFARDIAGNIMQYEVKNGVLRDYFNWRDYGEPTIADTLQLSYIDAPTLKMMAADDAAWQPVTQRTGELLLRGRRASGLFFEQFDFNAREYKGERQNMINQLYCALFAAEFEDHHPFAAWLKERFAKDGKLCAEYDSVSGEPTQTFESTSVYALAARYAYRVNDRQLGDKLMQKLLDFQELNPLSPMYGGFCDDEVYSFDNLEALITLRLYNSGR